MLLGLLAAAAVDVAAGPASPPPRARTCPAREAGARGDGTTDDTAALQKALDACANGGVVRLAPGRYLTGPLTLHSHETLEIPSGATLVAVEDPTRYASGKSAPRPLISAQKAKDVALVGGGTIDGRGESWWRAFHAAKEQGGDRIARPRLVEFRNVDGLLVSGVTLKDSPSFHLVPANCSHVRITGVTVQAPADAPNTDGIDPSGHDILIDGVTVDTGDDNIAIKSFKPDPNNPGAATSRIIIRNSRMRHGHGVSIGSQTAGGVEDVLVENVEFDGTDTALRIKTGRGQGGVVRNITFRNIRMNNVAEALRVSAYYPGIPKVDTAQPVGPGTPDISGITFENVRGEGVGKLGNVVGLPERAVRGVTFRKVALSGAQPLVVRNAEVAMDGATLTTPKGALSKQSGAQVTGAAGAAAP